MDFPIQGGQSRGRCVRLGTVSLSILDEAVAAARARGHGSPLARSQSFLQFRRHPDYGVEICPEGTPRPCPNMPDRSLFYA